MSAYLQYANSPIIKQMLDDFAVYFGDLSWVDTFYNDVLNIDTATTWGLDQWAKRVGIMTGRTISINPSPDDPNYSNLTPRTYTLNNEQLRMLILLRAFTNISRPTISNINKALSVVFAGRGRAYAQDIGNMSQRVVVNFPTQDWEIALLNSEHMPRASGVLMQISRPVIAINEGIIVVSTLNIGIANQNIMVGG